MYRFSDILNSTELKDEFIKVNGDTINDSRGDSTNSRSKSKKKAQRKGKKSVTESSSAVASPHVNYDNLCLETCGFRNVRNSCFLNASLQLLLNTPPLCAIIHSLLLGPQSTACTRPTSMLGLLSQLISQLNPQPTVINKFGMNRLTPTKILTPAVEFREILQVNTGQQEDVAECLMAILSQLHQDFMNHQSPYANKDNTLPTSSVQNVSSEDTCDWIVTDRFGKRHPEAKKIGVDNDGQSPIKLLFSGTMTTQSSTSSPSGGVAGRTNKVTNTGERKCHAIEEPFFILPLEISNPQVTSIETALHLLAQSEHIVDYHTVTGDCLVNVHRRSRISKAPPYFIFQLNRFSPMIQHRQHEQCVSHAQSTNNNPSVTSALRIDKLLKSVHIPLRLNIQKSAVFNQESPCQFSAPQCRYRIWAVIFHIGSSVTSGHYTIAVHHPCSHPSQFAFLYLDDQNGCLIKGESNVTRLLNSHCAIDAKSGTFSTPTVGNLTQSDDTTNQLHQPRTPYIVVYKSVYTRDDQTV